VTGAAVAVGPVLGGVITSGIGWEWIFFVNVPIGAVAVFITLMKVTDSRDPNATGVDWAGLLTFSGSLFLLVFALVQGNEKGWGSTQIVAFLIAAAVLLVAFVRRRAPAEPADARPGALPPPGLRRREHRRVRDLGLVLRHVPLPDALHPGCARLQPAAGGTAVPAGRPCCPSSWRPWRES
jgi:MFS family permease